MTLKLVLYAVHSGTHNKVSMTVGRGGPGGPAPGPRAATTVQPNRARTDRHGVYYGGPGRGWAVPGVTAAAAVSLVRA